MLSNTTHNLGNALGIVDKSRTAHHPQTELKLNGAASSSQASKALNAADQKNDASTTTILDALFSSPLLSLVGDYADETQLNHETKRIVKTKHIITTTPTPTTLFSHMTGAHATRVALNLLWHLDVENTLAFAKANSACLRSTVVVEVEDPHGQRVRGTVLQILLSAGDRNPREMKKGESDWGLVERLRPCFETIPEEFDKQYQAWSARCKAETEKTHAPFYREMDTLLKKIIKDENKVILDAVPFEDLLKLGIAQEFKEALKPHPEHIAEGGLLFDFPRMVLKLIDLLNNNKEALGDYGSLQYDLFATIVYSALLTRLQRCDLEVVSAEKGIEGVVDGKCEPRQIDYKKGLPDDLKGIGDRFIIAYWGTKYNSAVPRGLRDRYGRRWVVSKLGQAKNTSPGLCNTRGILTERMPDNVILGSKLAANAASQ